MIRTIASRSTAHALVLTPLALLFLAAAACGPASPQEEIAQIRADYTVELNSWRALEPEPAMDETAEMTDETEDAAGEAGEEADEYAEPEMAAGPQPADVLFDLVVYFKGRKALDGITIDVTHADAAQEEKAVYHYYVETAGIVSGETRQVDFVIEGIELEDGDAFAIAVVPGIPADRGAYREFSGSAP